MAHLTIQIGASIIIPFRTPRGLGDRRRKPTTGSWLRWRALREAAVVSGKFTRSGGAISLPQIGYDDAGFRGVATSKRERPV